MKSYRLMRTWYKTDKADSESVEDADYVGAFSDIIPESAFRDGAQIVHVDWSKPGEVEVTFLKPHY